MTLDQAFGAATCSSSQGWVCSLLCLACVQASDFPAAAHGGRECGRRPGPKVGECGEAEPPAERPAGERCPALLAAWEAVEAAPRRVRGKVARRACAAGPRSCCGDRNPRVLGAPGVWRVSSVENPRPLLPAAPAGRVPLRGQGRARLSRSAVGGACSHGACSHGGGAGPESGGEEARCGRHALPRTTQGTRWFCR